MFSSLADLEKANREAGQFFFEPGDCEQDTSRELINGRFVLVTRADRENSTQRRTLYLAKPDGRIMFLDWIGDMDAEGYIAGYEMATKTA